MFNVSVKVLGRLKLARTVLAASIVTTQGLVSPQPPPDQPANAEPEAGIAVIVTFVPWPKLAVQVAPQSMPVGADVTEPVPVPLFVIVNAKVLAVKAAVTVVAAFKVTVH